MLYWFLKWFVIGPFLRLRFKVRVVGRENVPRRGAVILAANHLHFYDSPLIAISVPRRVSFGAKSEFFTGKGLKGWLVRQFFVRIGQIPVDRTNARQALTQFVGGAVRLLQDGGCVGIHPEGTRTDGRLHKGRPGVAQLAKDSGALIVPIGIVGTNQRYKKWRSPVTIHIGAAITVEEYAALNRPAVTDLVMRRIGGLIGEEPLGVCAALV